VPGSPELSQLFRAARWSRMRAGDPSWTANCRRAGVIAAPAAIHVSSEIQNMMEIVCRWRGISAPQPPPKNSTSKPCSAPPGRSAASGSSRPASTAPSSPNLAARRSPPHCSPIPPPPNSSPACSARSPPSNAPGTAPTPNCAVAGVRPKATSGTTSTPHCQARSRRIGFVPANLAFPQYRTPNRPHCPQGLAPG